MKRIVDHQTFLWMRPILAVLFCCLLMFCCIGLFILNQLRQSVEESGEYLNRFVQSTVDKRLEEVYRYTLALELNGANTWLKTATVVPKQLPASVYRLHDSIRDFVTTTAVISGMYIYYPQLDFVVGNLGCYSADGYRTLQNIPAAADASQWTDTLASGNTAHFLLDNQLDEQVPCYVRPQVLNRSHKAVMVVELDVSALLQAFAQVQETEPAATSLYVFLDDTVIASEGTEVDSELARELFEHWDKRESATLTKGSTTAFFNQSMLSGLYYASFYTGGQAMRTLQTSVLVCAVGALATLVVGVIGAVCISRSRVKPLRSMLKKLGGPEEKGDAFQALDARIDKLLQEHSRGQQRIYEHQMLLDASFLRAVLRGDLRSDAAIFSAANRYDVLLDAPLFQMLLVGSTDHRAPEGDGWRKKLYSILESEQVSGLAAVFGERLCVLLNMENEYPQETLDHLCKRLQDAFYPEEDAAAGIGTVSDSLSGIVTSYHCARRALLAGGFSTDHPVRTYRSQMAPGHPGDNRAIQNFSSCIYQHQFGRARQMLDQLFEEYLSAGYAPSSDLMRQNAVNCLLIDAAGELLPESEVLALTRNLSHPLPLTEYRACLSELLGRLDKTQLHIQSEEHRPSIAARAKQIIDEGFTNPMLGLYLISEQLNVSNSYLSTAFKNAYKISVVQYINKLRIERAKQMITDTSMSIKEIALATGFSSDIHFIRVFKKQENKTPTMLRRGGGDAGEGEIAPE